MQTLKKPELIAEITEATKGLPPYQDGPAVDYTNAPVAYATEIVLTHNPLSFLHGHFTETTEVLMTRHGRERGELSDTWGAISGYVDTPPEHAAWNNPLAHTVQAELAEEIGVHDLTSIVFRLGERCQRYFMLPSGEKAVHHIIPVLGICGDRPAITPDKDEVTDARWAPLLELQKTKPLAPHYLKQTLRYALAAVAMDADLLYGATGSASRLSPRTL